MKTAVVILNWNGEHYLQQFLPPLLRHTGGDTEIIVADNGSTDGSVKTLQEEFPQVRLLLLKKNYGFAGGYNLALEQIDARYYVLLNSDVEVTQQWLEPLGSLLDNHPHIAACAAALLDY